MLKKIPFSQANRDFHLITFQKKKHVDQKIARKKPRRLDFKKNGLGEINENYPRNLQNTHTPTPTPTLHTQPKTKFPLNCRRLLFLVSLLNRINSSASSLAFFFNSQLSTKRKRTSFKILKNLINSAVSVSFLFLSKDVSLLASILHPIMFYL